MIIESGRIAFQFKTQNPFVATMYHVDHYPAGDGKLGPAIKKPYNGDGDFGEESAWHMYYGEKVPGFPAHPHRGFETVTAVVQGTVDHTDGLGATGRYRDGDVQWMTAGKGLQHAEMFPLLNAEQDNTLELFQIWLSLDSKHRMADPDYKMLWREDVPMVTAKDRKGLRTKITVIAGEVNGEAPPAPTEDSWAYDKEHRLSIQLLELEPGAAYAIPAGYNTMNRSLYFYGGDALTVDEKRFTQHSYMFVTAGEETALVNEGLTAAKVLLLQSEPIPEPIIAYGPFVMTTQEEIRQAFRDYEKTQFGGWPFSTLEMFHGHDQPRFAKYADGTAEYPDKKETTR